MLSALIRATCCLKGFESKLKIVDLCWCAEGGRRISSGKVCSSRRIKPQIINRFDKYDYGYSKNDPKDFGKVVCLDPNDVETVESNQTQFRKKRKVCQEPSNFKQKYNEMNLSCDSLNSSKSEAKPTKKISQDIQSNLNLLRSTMLNLKSRKQRQKQQKIMLEGKRLIHDAISAGCELLSVFYSRLEDIETLRMPENVNLYKTPYKSLQLWSDVITSQGVIAIFKIPNLQCKKSYKTIPLTIICDNVREPGNLGAMLRVATCVGSEKIILTKGCADIWDPKVLRSAAGAHFRLPILKYLQWEEIENEVANTDHVVLADNQIPVEKDEINENNNNNEFGKSNSFKTKSFNDLPLQYYDSLNYQGQHVVIVIGGETHGLSEAAYLFARQRNGLRVCIPMCNKTESLNSAVSLGILSYEIKRQFDVSSKLQDGCSNEISEKSVISK